MPLFCYALLCVGSSFAIISKRKRKLVALLLLSYRCIITINVLWFFLKVPWVSLQCVIVVLSDHTHFLMSLSFSLNVYRRIILPHTLAFQSGFLVVGAFETQLLQT